MCTEYRGCGCYRSRQEFEQERERIAVASRLEHQVLAALRDEHVSVSPRALDFARLVRAMPEAAGGASVETVLIADASIYVWLAGDGTQYHARLDAVASVRLVA